MESLKIKGSEKPTQEKIIQQLDKIEEATVGEELEAKRKGISVEEYQKEKRKFYGVEHPDYTHRKEETESSTMINNIKQWEKAHKEIDQNKFEQLPFGIEIVRNPSIPEMSHTFLSHLLRTARTKMMTDNEYKKHNPVLGKLSDVTKIEIKKIEGTDKLQFDVYINVRAILKKHTQFFIFKMDSSGEIILT